MACAVLVLALAGIPRRALGCSMVPPQGYGITQMHPSTDTTKLHVTVAEYMRDGFEVLRTAQAEADLQSSKIVAWHDRQAEPLEHELPGLGEPLDQSALSITPVPSVPPVPSAARDRARDVYILI